MSSAIGTAGTDWDLYEVACLLVLDQSITSANPFTFNLLAGALTDFDSSQSQSWLIVTATEIAGAAFDPEAWTVNTTDFEANNPLESGEFFITQSGSQLYLNFSPTYTALDNWRFANFGTYDNSGIAADHFDADQDGVSNLLEYATGLDPRDSSDSSALSISQSLTNPGEMELTFNRIDDPTLTYTLEGTHDLSLTTWPTIWTEAGTANEKITIPESLWSSGEACFFFRLGVSY